MSGKLSQAQLDHKRAYRAANPERMAQQRRTYRVNNRTLVARLSRGYHQRNQQKEADRKRAYALENREQIAERNRAYRQANREQVHERKRVRAKRVNEAIQPTRKGQRWSDAEDAIVVRDDVGIVEICSMLSRTYHSVMSRRGLLIGARKADVVRTKSKATKTMEGEK